MITQKDIALAEEAVLELNEGERVRVIHGDGAELPKRIFCNAPVEHSIKLAIEYLDRNRPILARKILESALRDL